MRFEKPTQTKSRSLLERALQSKPDSPLPTKSLKSRLKKPWRRLKGEIAAHKLISTLVLTPIFAAPLAVFIDPIRNTITDYVRLGYDRYSCGGQLAFDEGVKYQVLGMEYLNRTNNNSGEAVVHFQNARTYFEKATKCAYSYSESELRLAVLDCNGWGAPQSIGNAIRRIVAVERNARNDDQILRRAGDARRTCKLQNPGH